MITAAEQITATAIAIGPMLPVVYIGSRLNMYSPTVVVDGELLSLRLDLSNHSPSGFDWGYRGSGPAQLALAILSHHCGSDEQRAIDHYQEFKRLIIALIDADSWVMSSQFVEDELQAIEVWKAKL